MNCISLHQPWASLCVLPSLADASVPTGALAFGDFSLGRFAWALRNPVMFSKPIPYRGRQGFFSVPDDVVAEQLKAVTV